MGQRDLSTPECFVSFMKDLIASIELSFLEFFSPQDESHMGGGHWIGFDLAFTLLSLWAF